MIKMDSEKECPFDTLLKRSVPHVPEKIFFSLDYKSFKSCLNVSKEWNKLLMSKAYLRKAASLFQEEALREGEELLCRKVRGAWRSMWLRELKKLSLILLIVYSVYILLINWIMYHEDKKRLCFEYVYEDAKTWSWRWQDLELALSKLGVEKRKQIQRKEAIIAPMVTFIFPILMYFVVPLISPKDMGIKEETLFLKSYRFRAERFVSKGIFGWHYKVCLEMLHGEFLREEVKDLVQMHTVIRWASLIFFLIVSAIMLLCMLENFFSNTCTYY